MTTPTSMGNHGGTATSCSPYAHPSFAEICMIHRTRSTVALGTYELAFLIKKDAMLIRAPHKLKEGGKRGSPGHSMVARKVLAARAPCRGLTDTVLLGHHRSAKCQARL